MKIVIKERIEDAKTGIFLPGTHEVADEKAEEFIRKGKAQKYETKIAEILDNRKIERRAGNEKKYQETIKNNQPTELQEAVATSTQAHAEPKKPAKAPKPGKKGKK